MHYTSCLRHPSGSEDGICHSERRFVCVLKFGRKRIHQKCVGENMRTKTASLQELQMRAAIALCLNSDMSLGVPAWDKRAKNLGK